MSVENKNKCCEGCKNGKPGQNKSCAAKLMMAKLKEKQKFIKTEVL